MEDNHHHTVSKPDHHFENEKKPSPHIGLELRGRTMLLVEFA